MHIWKTVPAHDLPVATVNLNQFYLNYLKNQYFMG